MLSGEWERIKQLFEAALNLPAESRGAYLDSACNGNEDQKATVLELLGNHAKAGKFLDEMSVRIRHVFSQGDLIANRFRILHFISSGGMGEVYEAFDERLKVRLALKTLRPELASDRQALQRFEREIRIAREVSHESLCKVFDLVEHTDPVSGAGLVPCLTMQLIEGESLLSYLRTHRPLPPADALGLARQIAAAVDTLHQHGIIHRDLKPSNVMLTTARSGALRAVVTDFGLAKLTATETEFAESLLDFQAGAPYFMAPELLRGSRPTAASDIYAFGLIVDEMVTRRRAFSAESLQSLYYQKLWESPAAPTHRSENLSPRWDRAILRCLHADPDSRYERACDAVEDIESAAASAVVSVPLPGLVANQSAGPQAGARQAINSRWRWWIVSTAVLTLLAGVVALGGIVLQPFRTSVAVFPIDNLTNRPDLNYLGKGITAEVMRRLTMMDGVRVIPYHEPRGNVPLNSLRGRFSLEGLLQVSGGRVRLTVQLSDNHDGALTWSQNFEQEMQNPLQLQSDIAEGSVRALEARTLFGSAGRLADAGLPISRSLRGLVGLQDQSLPKSATTSAAAFDRYIRGVDLIADRNVPSALKAVESLQSALRDDPSFALAAAELSQAQFVLMDYDYEPTETLVARARDYAEQAVQLNPQLAEGYTALAGVRQTMWDFAGAEDAYKTALKLNPRFSQAHRWYAGLILQFGRYDEALSEVGRALELDPYDFPGQSSYGLYLYYSRRYKEAAAKLEDTLAQKELISARNALGDVYFQLAIESRGSEAASCFEKALKQADIVEAAIKRNTSVSAAPSQPVSIKFSDRMHAQYYSLSGRPDLAQVYADRLRSDTAAQRTSPVPLAMFYAVTGEGDQAIDLLERAAAHKDRQLLYLKVSPQFDRLRQMPRFQALLKTMGL